MNPRNPYYVLELEVTATPGDIERQGRKLLGLLEVGATKAKTYRSPLGTFERDATMVRDAMAALRDPNVRTKEALLAGILADVETAESTEEADAPLADGFAAAGYRGL